MKPIHRQVFKAALLILFGLLIYANSFSVPFHFDDNIVIADNRSIKLLPDWPATVKAVFHVQASRFLTLVTFAVNFYYHRLDVFGYHLVNLLIHVMTGLAVWWLGELFALLLSRPRPGDGPVKVSKKNKPLPAKIHPAFEHIPFAAAFIFLAHPVHTEAVTYISQRCESMAALFYVVSVGCYLKGRLQAPGASVKYFGWAAVSGLLAMLSKETAISLPLMILFFETVHFKRPARHVWGICLLAAVVVPALFRFDMAMLWRSYESQSHLGDVLTLPTYLLTQLRSFVGFLRLLVWPVGLNLDHDFVMSRSLFEPATFGSLLILAGLLAAAVRFKDRAPAFALAVFWFFIALSSNLIPRTHVFFEHKLYLASTGVIPALALALAGVVLNRRMLFAAMGCAAIVLGLLTYQRNTVWQSPVRLWSDVIAHSPEKGRGYLSLGAAYARAKEYDKAIETLTKAAAVMGDPIIYSTRAAVHVLMKNDDEALKDLNRAIAKKPTFIEAYIGRGELFMRRRDFSAAARDYDQAIAMAPAHPDGYKMRGRLNEAMMRNEAALADYNKAIELSPNDAQILSWRGYLYASTGQKDLAARDFERAVRVDPRYVEGYVFRGMHRMETGLTQEALQDFNKAIALKPNGMAYYQRAQLNFRIKKFNDAMTDVNKALSMGDNDQAYGLRARLYVESGQYAQALADLDRAIGSNPRSFDAYLNRGLVQLSLGHADEAVSDFTKAITLNPKSVNAYRRRAQAYLAARQPDLALADQNKVLSLRPDSAADYVNRASIYQQQGNEAGARKDIERARQMGLDVPDDFLTSKTHEPSH